MRRKLIIALIIFICFLLQTTVFQTLSLGGIAPNLMVIVVAAFGFMRGRKEGLFVGLFCGLLVDIFCGSYIGIYALIYMYIGYINGVFQKHFYPDDIKLPMIMISASDLVANLATFVVYFLVRGKMHIFYYLRAIILPELIYTMVVAILLYFVLMKINQKLESYEKKGEKKFNV